MKDLGKWYAKFDFLVDLLEEGDTTNNSYINKETKKYLKKFLELGCDKEHLFKMLSPKDICANYDTLVSHGFKFNTTDKIAKLIDGEQDGECFLYSHLDDFVRQGADINDIVNDLCYDFSDDTVYPEEYYKKAVREFLSLGANPLAILSLSKDRLLPLANLENDQSELIDNLKLYQEHGLSTKDLEKFLDEIVCDWGTFSHLMFEKHSSEWKSLGFNLNDYIEKYFNAGCLWSEWTVSSSFEYGHLSLPDDIPVEKFLQHASMEEILDEVAYFDDFIYESKCDINVLAQKFVDEIGYNNDDEYYTSCVYSLIINGADNIDIEKFFQMVGADSYTIDDFSYYKDMISPEKYAQILSNF